MNVKFVLELNVQTSTRGGYRDLIRQLREQLGVRSSHNVPALAVQREPPTEFFDLVLLTNTHSVRFRLRTDNLYLLGYRMEDGQWLEFGNARDRHVITEPGTSFLGFRGDYNSMVGAAHQSVENTTVGFYSLGHAVNQLATTQDGQARARGLIVVCMMICEATRFNDIRDHMARNFDNSRGTTDDAYNAGNRNEEGQIHGWIIDLARSWGAFSTALFEADANPQHRFVIRDNDVLLPPDNRRVTTLEQIIPLMGILLGLCFVRSGPGRSPRMVTTSEDDDQQCLSGLPMVELLSVSVDSSDSIVTRQVYGTITVIDGLRTQYIYNRSKGSPENIRSGDDISLTGPSVAISALGVVTIKVLLHNQHIHDELRRKRSDQVVSEIIHDHVMTWNAYETGNEYDKLISEKLEIDGGSATVNYAVFRNAVAASVFVNLFDGGDNTSQVYGHVSTNWDSDNAKTASLLFNRESDDYVDVRRHSRIPLSRSTVAVPLTTSTFNVTVKLHDHNIILADSVIADDTVTFPVETSGDSSKIIATHGDYKVLVTVAWAVYI